MKRTGTEEDLEEEQPRTKRSSAVAVRKLAYADAGSEDEDDPENQINSSGEDVAPRRKAVPAPQSKRGKGAAAAAPSSSSSSSSSRGKKKSRPAEEDDDADEDDEAAAGDDAGGNDDDEDEDFAPAPKKRATTKRAAAKRSAAALDEDDEDDFDDDGNGRNGASHSSGPTYDDDDEVLEDEDGTPCDYEVGQIAMVEVENFMNHRKFSMPFCRNVNFITGRNGSGKSAIATALMLCLGSRAAATGRSTNLSKLIREGSPGPAVLKGEGVK